MNPNSNYNPSYYQDDGGYYGQDYQGYDTQAYGQENYPQERYAPQEGYQEEYQEYGAYYGDDGQYGQNYSAETQFEQQSSRYNTEPGYYYPHSIMPFFTPALYSAPVSALAYDRTYACLYVASHTQPFGERPRRASMLVTHSFPEGMLYASCGAHPESDIGTIQQIYKEFFCGSSPGSRAGIHVPSHAYQPPYGATALNPQSPHIGITSLLPLPSPGFVVSVSPAGVRTHTSGGLCVSDQEKLPGMLCGTILSDTHVAVGGVGGLHCLDSYQNLKIISSHSNLRAMSLGYNTHKQNLVAGCNDGTLRMVDSRLRREVAKIKSHTGGVTDLDLSDDGSLIVTTGLAARSGSTSIPYAFPDPHLFVYDTRYLGRGGIAHPFGGVNGAPRLVSFVPGTDTHSQRILAASGQSGGGMQIVLPFEEADPNPASYIFPQLGQGEAMTCMAVHEDLVAVGTNMSNVLQFELAGYKEIQAKGALKEATPGFILSRPSGSQSFAGLEMSSVPSQAPVEKVPLEVPNFVPDIPPLSIDPTILQVTKQSGVPNEEGKTVFNMYTMCAEPAVSSLGPIPNQSSFRAIATNPLVPTGTMKLNPNFLKHATQTEHDIVPILRTSNLGLDLLENHLPEHKTKRKKNITILPNPNKMIFTESLSDICFLENNRRRRKVTGKRRSNEMEDGIPDRYRLILRPPYVVTPHFGHCTYNLSNLWPGWDYPPSMPSAHAPSVLMLLFFIPEIRAAILEKQFDAKLWSSKTVESVPPLSTEMSFVFHNIEAISQNAFTYPGNGTSARVGVFVPTNFLTTFCVLPEATNMALLDDNPAVAVKARRPEAFYRFLLYHLDKETKKQNRLVDSLHGLNFISANEFATGSGPPSDSSVRALTVDLSYEPFIDLKEPKQFRFGEVLRHALCGEARLRAWCKATKSYETVIHRKVASCLPEILSLSCACAGRKDEEGLCVWRTTFDKSDFWLPEMIEVELEEGGNVIVRELIETDSGEEKWLTFDGKIDIPQKMVTLIREDRGQRPNLKFRYQLEAVLSFVRDDMDPQYRENDFQSAGKGKADGHHVLHVRVPAKYKRRALTRQKEQADQLVKLLQKAKSHQKMTLVGKTDPAVVKKRSDIIKDQSKAVSDEWILFNNFVVSPTVVEDARAFHSPFKEPCIVTFRAISSEKEDTDKTEAARAAGQTQGAVLFSRSISNNKVSKHSNQKSPNELPGKGDLIAFDAEFVSVQEEESILTDSRNKVTVRETRHALARISLIDCRNGKVILDDHVLPREPVVDYLTRFSGIVQGDLDPKTSPHHLISSRTAYLKLRYFQERGCIFLGHGLSQDFLTANLFVPPNQIIDTVEVYHKDQMRYISLRFLANYVLKRDMQTDVHDSIEDARAAFELYQRAVELGDGLDAFLMELYEYGQKTDWRIGFEEEEG